MKKEDDKDDESSALEQLSAANQAASKGPLSALLSPTFEILGKEAGDWTKRLIEKRKDNKKAHIEAVRDQIGSNEREPSELMLKNLTDWEEQAALFDGEDEESSVWRGVLDEILTTKTNQKELIEAAKGLNQYDIKAIRVLGAFWDKYYDLKKERFGGIKSSLWLVLDPKSMSSLRGSYKKLIDQNLFFSQRYISLPFSVIVALILVLFIVILIGLKVSPEGLPFSFSGTEVGLFFLSILALIFIFPSNKFTEKVYLTYLGKRLYFAIKKYSNNVLD